MKAPIKGSGQVLKVFEDKVKYLSNSDIEPDSDGYVRGNLVDKGYISACLVPVDSESYDLEDYGEDFIGMSNLLIRNYEQEDSNGNGILITLSDAEVDYSNFGVVIVLNTGDYIVSEGVKWKIVEINSYDEIIKCRCGRMDEGGFDVV